MVDEYGRRCQELGVSSYQKHILNQKRNLPCGKVQINTNMKIRIKLDLYVLKEYFIVTLCERNVGEA